MAARSDVTDVRLEGTPQAQRSELDLPFTLDEVKRALARVNNSAAGIDGVTRQTLKELGARKLLILVNVFMACGYSPEYMRRSRIVLIPKKPNASDPKDLRPLAMPSKVIRLFHSLLANRLDVLGCSERQKAYQRRDGMLENLWILDGLFEYSKSSGKDLYVVYVDVSKAFDTVSHAGLVPLLRQQGAPEVMLGYFSKVYGDMNVVFPGENEPVKKGQGVGQGDPASGPIFNLHVDEA